MIACESETDDEKAIQERGITAEGKGHRNQTGVQYKRQESNGIARTARELNDSTDTNSEIMH